MVDCAFLALETAKLGTDVVCVMVEATPATP